MATNPIAIQNRVVRILLLVAIASVMAGAISFGAYLAQRREKTTNLYEFDKDPPGPEPTPNQLTVVSYTDNAKPYLLIVSSVFVFVSLFCVIYILTKFVNVFASSAKPIVNYVVLLLVIFSGVAVLGANVWYAFVKPPVPLPENCCTNPLKYKTQQGECKCLGNLTEIKGICKCAPGNQRTEGSPYICKTGCASNLDCATGQTCNIRSGVCCASDQTVCGKTCCGKDQNCLGEAESEACCATASTCNTRTGVKCCGILETCVEDGDEYQKCKTHCGQNLVCEEDEECFSMTGVNDSVDVYHQNLITTGGIPETDIEILRDGDGKDSTISYCAKPNLANFISEPQYFPTVLKARGPFLDYYPCLTSQSLTPLAKQLPNDKTVYKTPYDLNVCIPKPPDDPNAITEFGDKYFSCFERLRPTSGQNLDASKCEVDGECTLVNLMHEDYTNPSRQDTIFRTIAVNTLRLKDPGAQDYRAYQGSYCGHPAYRVINNTVNSSASPQEAALACAQMGAYADSKYIAYGETKDPNGGETRRYCNTLFDCQDFSSENKNRFRTELNSNNSGKYFKEFKFGNIKKTFNTLNSESPDSALRSQMNGKNHYIYETKCPELHPINPDIFPSGCTGATCDYNDCPGDMSNIQTDGITVNNGSYYNTNVCTPLGYIDRLTSESAGSYFSIELPVHSNNLKDINLYPNNSCNRDSTTLSATKNCYTADQWRQVTRDYNFSLPLSNDIKSTIINSDDGQYKLYQPTFNTKCGNCSSQHGGIISKTEVINTGGGKCKWSAHMGSSSTCPLLPNTIRIVRVTVEGELINPASVKIKPSVGGEYTIRDNDYVIILGDDGYGGNFTGLGSWCNGEWLPCLRGKAAGEGDGNAHIPSKRDAVGNLVPDWDHPDVYISSDHALFSIKIEDDPYIYEELFDPNSDDPLKWLRRERAFSLKKVAGPFKGSYVQLPREGSWKACNSCEGGALVMQFSSLDIDADTYMSTCVFVLSDTADVVPPIPDTLFRQVRSCPVSK